MSTPHPPAEPMPGYDDDGQPLAEDMPTERTDVPEDKVRAAREKAGDA